MMIPPRTPWRDKLTEILANEVPIKQGSIPVDGTIINWIAGVIQSQHEGLVRAGVRIKVGDRADLRVRWIPENDRRFIIGQRVIAAIPAQAVRLESGLFRRSKQRWNRWVGRIVLVEQWEGARLYTVKIHGEVWTIKSCGVVLGTEQAMRPWDVVNVVVDPQEVDLMTVGMRSWHYK
ncbi:MAG TPA: hypothetical protein VF019_09350 [Nitrospira sp.]